ncbi:MAG: Lrp/AsnC family transcriptional regulator for asnA, asnC and gidA [Candidatus Azotimanducaceae bacterium]|jgi:Lrp/AsnC family transcriptional regulator for asnA, asnC and gidA
MIRLTLAQLMAGLMIYMARGIRVVEQLDESESSPDGAAVVGSIFSEDKLNREIVGMLQSDGRMAFSEIAKSLAVSEGTIRNRVNSMKQAGMLRIVAIADPVAAEYKSDAMLGIKVAVGHTVQALSERLAASPDVVYILCVSGRYDLLVEVVSNDRNGFLDFLDKEIHSQLDIASSETMTGLKNFKNQFLLKQNWS